MLKIKFEKIRRSFRFQKLDVLIEFFYSQITSKDNGIVFAVAWTDDDDDSDLPVLTSYKINKRL